MQPTNHSAGRIVKTRIVATVGPATSDEATIRELMLAGADIFRFNFAHGAHEWLGELLAIIRGVSAELGRPVGVLGDLSGPKIPTRRVARGRPGLRRGSRVLVRSRS